MNRKIKEYLEYRKNMKTARRALAAAAAALLPAAQDAALKGSGVIHFIIRLSDAAKDISGERLVKLVLSEVSAALRSDNGRILEILSYMAALDPKDIRKILMHSAVETMPDNTGSMQTHRKDGDSNG